MDNLIFDDAEFSLGYGMSPFLLSIIAYHSRYS